MKLERLFAMKFSSLYPSYLKKVTSKQRTQDELDQVIRWLTGYTPAAFRKQLAREVDIRTFFDESPKWNPHAELVTGVVCGVRVEEVPDPLMRKIRRLDKLVDELAKGRPMEKVLRKPA